MGVTCSKCVAEGDNPYGAQRDAPYNHHRHRRRHHHNNNHGGGGGIGAGLGGGGGGVGSSSSSGSARRSSSDAIDPAINEIQRQSWTLTQHKINAATTTGITTTTTTAANHHGASSASSSAAASAPIAVGQHHLLYKQKGSNHTKSSKFLPKMPRPESAPQATHSSCPSLPPSASTLAANNTNENGAFPTRLIVRRHAVRSSEEGLSGTHIYAMRWSAEQPLKVKSRSGKEDIVFSAAQEQCPRKKTSRNFYYNNKQQQQQQDNNNSTTATTNTSNNTFLAATLPTKSQLNAQQSSMTTTTTTSSGGGNIVGASSTMDTGSGLHKTPLVLPNWNANSSCKLSEKDAASVTDNLFKPSIMNSPPKQRVPEWITVSEEHNVHILDSGLTAAECDYIVQLTEHLCRGQYAAYTYAKQTLGCREFPMLAAAVQDIVHRVTYSIVEFSNNNNLALDDREPHMVKYDLTKKERQKLDMHTDKSEWTFLISLSNGCGLDYDGGGTYFECLDATVHLQRGHCLVFPGKLRHCGQRISTGLRFLLVGFLVDKSANQNTTTTSSTTLGASLNNNFAGGGNPTIIGGNGGGVAGGENDRDLATALHMHHHP